MILFRFLSVCIGYACGLFLFGYFIGKAHHVDIRKKGSGNVGTTNTLRILGVRSGAVTLVLDCMKAVIAALIVTLVFFQVAGLDAQDLKLLRLYAAFGAVLGHMFPVYFRFKGGKGIATGMGFLIIAEPRILVVAVLIFVVLVAITRYVSLGSVMAAISLPVQGIIYYCCGFFQYGGSRNLEAFVLVSIAGCLAVILHHSNIGRLLHGNENKFTFHPKTENQ